MRVGRADLVSFASHPSHSAPPLFSIYAYALHPLTQDDRDRQGNTNMGRFISWVLHASHSKGAEPQRSPFLGSLYVYTLRCRTTKFGVVTHMRQSRVLGGQVPTTIAYCINTLRGLPAMDELLN